MKFWPLLLSGMLFGCMQPPEINKDFGPEYSGAQLNELLSSTQAEVTGTSSANTKKGEFVYREVSSQIEDLHPVIFRQRWDTVVDRQEDSQTIKLRINRQMRELDGNSGVMKPSQDQANACISKVSGACNSSQFMTLPDLLGQWLRRDSTPDPGFGIASGRFSDLSWKALADSAASDSGSGTRWTFHKLKKTYSSQTPPPLVALRPDCGGRINPCSNPMKTIEVTFDEVDWSSEKYPVKYSYDLIFSPEAPFFSSQLQSCGTTTIPYMNQRITLLQCETVQDFTVGHD